jgi:hypothetical protein
MTAFPFSKESKLKKILTIILFTSASFAGFSPANASSWNNRNSNKLSDTWVSSSSATEARSESEHPLKKKRREVERTNISPFSPDSHNVSFHLGQVFLMGDEAKLYKDSIGMRLNYTYGVSDIFGFDSSFGFSEHSQGGFSMASLLTGVRTNLNWFDKIIPYGIFGMGFYKPSYKITPITNASGVLFGIHMGLGLDLSISEHVFFGTQLTFYNVFRNTVYSPDNSKEIGGVGSSFREIGGNTSSFLVHAGVTL